MQPEPVDLTGEVDKIWGIFHHGWDTLWLCQQFAIENGDL